MKASESVGAEVSMSHAEIVASGMEQRFHCLRTDCKRSTPTATQLTGVPQAVGRAAVTGHRRLLALHKIRPDAAILCEAIWNPSSIPGDFTDNSI